MLLNHIMFNHFSVSMSMLIQGGVVYIFVHDYIHTGYTKSRYMLKMYHTQLGEGQVCESFAALQSSNMLKHAPGLLCFNQFTPFALLLSS